MALTSFLTCWLRASSRSGWRSSGMRDRLRGAAGESLVGGGGPTTLPLAPLLAALAARAGALRTLPLRLLELPAGVDRAGQRGHRGVEGDGLGLDQRALRRGDVLTRP